LELSIRDFEAVNQDVPDCAYLCDSIFSAKQKRRYARPFHKVSSNLLANILKDVINRDRKMIDRISIRFWRTENGDHNGV
jgi:hypothetical protein